MAQRVTVELVDDLDGGHADETVVFTVDGITYAIDLSHEHADQFRDSLCEWIKMARRIDQAHGRRSAPVELPTDQDVLAWAAKAGISSRTTK